MVSGALTAQSNALNETEFNNVIFNGVSIQDVIDTNGSTSMMQSLFGNDLIVENGYSEALEYWVKFSTNAICIEFYNGMQNGSAIVYDLASIEFKNSNSELYIKNKSIMLGDSGNVLSGLNSRTVEGKRVYTFQLNDYDSYVYVYVDIASNKVIKIGYNGNLF